MGSKGSTEAELDSERIGVRAKTPKVLTFSKPVGSEEEGSATLGCAVPVQVCVQVWSLADQR